MKKSFALIIFLIFSLILFAGCSRSSTEGTTQTTTTRPSPTITQAAATVITSPTPTRTPKPTSTPTLTIAETIYASVGHSNDLLPKDGLLIDAAFVPHSNSNVDLLLISYFSDGLKVKGYIAAPKTGGALPCVIFNRGGNRDSGAITDKYGSYMLGEIASWGYVVVVSQYRGNAGGEGQDEFGGSDIIDVINLIPLLESLPQVDENRIGMVGVSRGGMMTYNALTRTDRISAAIIHAGPTDLFDLAIQAPEMEEYVYSELIPDYENNKKEALENRSAIFWVENLPKNTPLLLLHGDADERVNPSQTIRMAEALQENNHPYQLVIISEGGHQHQPENFPLWKDWLDQYVRDQQPWESP